LLCTERYLNISVGFRESSE